MEEFIQDMLWDGGAESGSENFNENKKDSTADVEGKDIEQLPSIAAETEDTKQTPLSVSISSNIDSDNRELPNRELPKKKDVADSVENRADDSTQNLINESVKESGISNENVADKSNDSVRHFAELPSDNSQNHSLQHQAVKREDFLDQEIDFDERLSQVQALLANMPKVASESTQVILETSKAEISNDLKNSSDNETLTAKSESPVVSPSNEQVLNFDSQEQTLVPPEVEHQVATELLQQDVSREVTKLKEFLGDRFQTLIFDVGKLPLAVPLAKLGGIHTYTQEDITPIFGTPDWFEGLIPAEQGNIMLVNTAKLIMPEKYEQIKDELDYKYAILLDDTRWALACSSVREAKTLEIDDIRWSEKGTKKEWFAGMVVQFMCALLEVDALINLLYKKGKEQKKHR